MKKITILYYLIGFCSLVFSAKLFAQNQATKWCFGNQAGLNFMTNPPSVFSHSMNTTEGCASIADAAGNLLFYTNGVNVWNQSHQVMANGSSIGGNQYVAQNSIIVKQPGNTNIYYIFMPSWGLGFNYATVDMSLAAGMGSVTALNVNLVPGNINSSYLDKVSATKHCNGTDIWVVTRENNWNWQNNNNLQNNFYAFLVTATGVNTTAVVSPANTWTNNGGWTDACMKISPNGTKIGLASSDNWNNNVGSNQAFELWDFNAGTGAITNSLALTMGQLNVNNWNWGYGCEFSPDGTKFYGSSPYWNNFNNVNDAGISQWDLCAGSPTAIIASEYTVAIQNQNNNNWNNGYYSMQLAPNGKIYIARYFNNLLGQNLDVINNPNLAGAACGYTAAAQSVTPGMCYYGLPNFMTSYLSDAPPPQPFTYTSVANNPNACFTASFTAPPNPTFVCAASGYTVTGISWNFGDPASGAANTSTLLTPVHSYPAPGIYTTVLTFFNACGSKTIALPVAVNGATLNINTASITCASLGSATVGALGGIGPFSYTWMPTAQASSVATGLQPGNYSITVLDNGGNCVYTSTVTFTSLIPFTGVLDNSFNIPCNGVGTGTANIVTAGGSGNNTYTWTNGVTALNTPSVNTLVGGMYTVTVIDALTSCSLTQNFFVNQPPAMVLNVGASSPTACAGTTVQLLSTNSGGTPGPFPGYTYSWTAGPATNTRIVTQAVAGTYSYYITSRDANNCNITNTIAIDFIPNPTVTVANASICPFQTATLTPSGATNYTFLPSGLSGLTFTDNPLVNTGYSFIGSAQGCTSSAAATASIILKPVPGVTITNNNPVCNGTALWMNVNAGQLYSWSGPLGFSQTVKSPTITPATPANSGVYTVTLTAINNCTASANTTLTVHQTPTITVFTNTVCVTQTINLFANSFAGASYFWSGPLSFTSSLQNPTITNATTPMNGVYNLTVTSVEGCTNTAFTTPSIVPMPIPLIVANNNSMCLGSNLEFNAYGGANYNWTGPNSFVSGVSNPVINNVSLAANGVYSLLVTTGPCTISATHSITVFPLPTPVAGANSPCDGKDLQLTGSGGSAPSYTFAWTGPQGYTSSLQNPVIVAATPTNTGTYFLLVTDINNCQANTSVQANVLINPIVLASGTTVCIYNPAVLTASGAVTYTWSGPNNYNANGASANIAAATSSQTQVYTVIGSAANSCTSVTTAVLNTIPLPVPGLTVTSKACINSTISLEGAGGDFYEWRGPYNLFATTQNVNFKAVNLAHSGTYTLTVFSNAGCNAKDTRHVQIDPAPDGDLLNSSGNSCVPFCADFSLRNKTSSPVVNTSWQVNGREFNSPTFTYCVVNAGDYVVTGSFTNAIGCMNTSSFQVSGYPVPQANFDYHPDKPIESFDQVTFASTSKGNQLKQWNWYFINNSGYKTTGETINYTFEEQGTYPVAMVVKNSWGCADTVVRTIVVEPDFNVYVPTAFTPNADELNDVFQPKGSGVVKYSLIVYDRWGQKIFQSTDFSKGWDGTFKGEECKMDVYVWKIMATDIKGKTKDLNGSVTLYR